MLKRLGIIISLMGSGIREVFSNVGYFIFTVIFSITILFIILWLPNLTLLASFLALEGVFIVDKILFALSGFLSLETNFTVYSAFIIVLISIFFSVNLAMLAYYFRKTGSLAVSGSSNLGGMISGLLGIGCLSCGSVVLSVLGLSGVVLLMPLRGEEFNLIAIVLLFISLYLTSKRIVEKTCKS